MFDRVFDRVCCGLRFGFLPGCSCFFRLVFDFHETTIFAGSFIIVFVSSLQDSLNLTFTGG